VIQTLIGAAQAHGINAELTYNSKDPPPHTANWRLSHCIFQLPGDAEHGPPDLVLIEGRLPLYVCRHPRCNGRSIHAVAEKLGITLPTTGDTYDCLTMTELLAGDYSIEYLLYETIVKGEVGFFGGVYKGMKTSVMMDCAISMTTGSPFLGSIPVLRESRVLFMSGESGRPVLQDMARRIYQSKRVEANDKLIITDSLPQLDDPTAVDKLKRTIAQHRADVLLIDPVYLCFGGHDHGNLFEQGKMLATIKTACRDAGVTPLLAHHVTKTAARKYAPLQLADMSQSGFAEFAAQWLLLSRREEFSPGEPHRLWLSVGGRAGHSALLQVDIDEGSRPNRKWDVVCGDGYAAKEADRLAKWCDKVLENLKQAKKPIPTSHAAKGIADKETQVAVLNHLIANKKIIASDLPRRARPLLIMRPQHDSSRIPRPSPICCQPTRHGPRVHA
jgi:hypothetical protein